MQLTLKAARINKGLNQKEAAKKLGISGFTLSGIETGKSSPNVKLIKKIEELYDVKFADLIFL